ncbi:coiled-coil domain-containing protein 191 isoform X2 [Aquila chrysaetos chrysaetos]|uniref:coiled-coil domain-containing protein 191 isoform X2 n=1 Tax=Aquila chrysaetos chrysaetos TaxID=223781 RepID=UPI00117731A8|nr:coiled-coil domain-containing protein 191 isoform X2 [Aquila chrysaetos chrysaetos]
MAKPLPARYARERDGRLAGVPGVATARPGHRPQLYRWRRLTAGAGPKKADQAPEYAVSEAFSLQKSRYPLGPCGPVTSLETVEQLQDHDEACEEAQELLSNWMKSKLQRELMSDGEEEVDTVLVEKPSAVPLKYERFDDLCSYLEHELESSSVQEYLQHLLQSEVVNCAIAEDLRLEDIKEKQKLVDPRIIMELRHKQVKENRMRRQKALELQRQEKSLKKSVLSEAKLQAQEEDRRKALKAKKEEEEIQREMVKLRKEMAEKRHTMAKAWRMEGKRQEESQKLSMQEVSITASLPLVLKEEEQGEEKQRRAQELLRRIHTNKQRCMQRHFSAWLKVILEHRIKMGKARALADWKCQLKALRAWRNYTWDQKVEQEIQQLEVHLQDQNRKKQLSAEHNQRRLLRCCFLAWQRWSQAETEKRELQIKREETKRKMAQLLEAVSLGKSGLDRPLEVKKPGTAAVNHHQDLQQDQPTKTCLRRKEPDQTRDHPCWDAAHTSHSYRKLKFAWEITVKHAALSTQDEVVYRNQIVSLPQQFQAPGPKTAPAYGSHFEHRHAFQQRLIEEQRQQLQKQRELILELQENQRLSRAKEESAQAAAVTQPLNNSVSQTREEKLKREKQSRCKNTTRLSPPVSHGPENTRAAMQGTRPSSQLTSAHPILKAMEERATQRAERRRKLEEAKQRREEEKLAQLKAEEEERQRKEAEEKEAQQKKRREERRQQKLKELEKQRRLEKEQQLQKKARDHYEKVLLRKLGMVPWKRLREQAKENLVVAQRHHCLGLQRKCLMTWLRDTQESLMEKVSQAEDFYSHTLLRRGFKNWLKYKDYLSTLEEKVSTLHAACLIRKYFWAWFDVIMEEKSTLWEKLKIATEHSNKRLMLNAFKAWKQYPLLMKKEREREERRNQLRRRVAEILPNFQT